MTGCCCDQKPTPTNAIEAIMQAAACPVKSKTIIFGAGFLITGVISAFTNVFDALAGIAEAVYKDMWKHEIPVITMTTTSYSPFVLTINEAEKEYNATEIPTASVMIGNDNNNTFTADSNGSQIWAKNGLNFMVAKEGSDIFYFSLCSTKIIDHKVSVIQGFDQNNDQLSFFCTKYQIKPEDISINHINNNTCVEVKGATDISAICLLGNIDIQPSDVIITTLGDVQQDLGINI